MQVNTDSVAILTKQILKSEVEVLKSRLDTGHRQAENPRQSSPRWLGDIAQMMVLFMCWKIGLKNWKERVYDNKQSR